MKPIDGYPSMRVAAVALYDQGMRPPQIAEHLGTSKQYVYESLKGKCARQIMIDEDTIAPIERAAEQRGVPVNAFIRDMLGVIASDDLFSAILDK